MIGAGHRIRRAIPVALLLASSALLAGAQHGVAAGGSDGFTGQVTATRSSIDSDGKSHTTDTRRVRLTVSHTAQLRGRQEIDVSWSGAHPTGGTVADLNSGDAANEEYPFVLLECRGVDSTSVPHGQQLRPETCWTQTWSERFSGSSTAWPAWRSDRYATTDQRSSLVKAPTPRPADCFRAAPAERWVPFDAVDGKTYPGGSVGCAGMAPESANVGGAGIPSNTTYGITGKDGKGSAQFDVWTSDENASLGCTDKVACALVAVPIEGTSCDAYGTDLPADDRPATRVQAQAEADCTATGQYAAGQPGNPSTAADLAVTGALWWSPSNWRNRITVPLTFAAPASECAVVSNASPTAIYGSVLMSELSAQWEPTFCTDSSLHPFVHVQTSDAAARTLLSNGSISAAFSSRSPDADTGFGRPVVQAPVAVTGFAISYAVDDANGQPDTKLRLNARLIAKLLSESYPGDSLVRDNYPALAKNPMTITEDPEFIALNPGLPKYVSLEAAATLSALASDADLTYALTSYLNDDPEARSWLNGNPDPWGMTVNPNYQDIALPVQSWPLLDDFTLPQSYIDNGNNPCYSYAPAPYLQLIANPSSVASTIVQNLQFGVSNADITCPNGVPGDIPSLRLSIQGRQQPGHRFVLGVTSLSAAHRYDLQTAALQTPLAHPDLHAQFSDASGRSFVAADDAGLRRAAATLHRDRTQQTYVLGDAFGPGAYPGTLPVYADVPTSGLTAADAKPLAAFLRYAAGTGQRPGLANGELPPGYLPLSSANGLSALASFTDRAADDVAAQDGRLPSFTGSGTVPAPTASTPPPPVVSPSAAPGSPVTAPTGGAVVLPDPLPAAGGPSGSGASPSAAPGAGAGTAAPPASTTTPDAGTVGLREAGAHSRLGSLALPIALVLGLACGLIGVLLRYPAAGSAAATSLARARRRVRTGRRR